MSWNGEQPFIADLPNLTEPPRFEEQSQLVAWIERERSRWEWLWSEKAKIGSLAGGMYSGTNQAINALLHLLANPLELRSDRNQLRELLHRAFNPDHGNAVPVSESEMGARILSIYNALGSDTGRWALEFYARNRPISQVTGREDLPLYLAAVSFDERVFGELGATLRAERQQYRSEITQLSNRVRTLEAERVRERESERDRARKLVRRLLRQTKGVWHTAAQDTSKKVANALSSIAAVEDKYETQMALMAPVRYWQGKAKTHTIWEAVYGFMCLSYFAFAGWAIARAAAATIEFLRPLGDDVRTSAYVITAGALLGGTTLLFWLGRVLVKLFLSEHHLRSECSEKAVMTQAFLSMETNQSSFGETERAIVLASIFKSSPDGIVKDEGPSDLAGTAILAKLLAR